LSAQHTPEDSEERCKVTHDARRALEEMKAEREMAEHRLERRRAGKPADEQADRRTPEERARDAERADARYY
jgi:hypothetical protein